MLLSSAASWRTSSAILVGEFLEPQTICTTQPRRGFQQWHAVSSHCTVMRSPFAHRGICSSRAQEDKNSQLGSLPVARYPQPRREEALAHHPDLVLDLPLFPARGRRTGGWLDQVMPGTSAESGG
jgi:hypothetical protein